MKCQRCGTNEELAWRGMPMTFEHICQDCIADKVNALRLTSGIEMMMAASNYEPTAVHRAIFAAYFNGTREGRA